MGKEVYLLLKYGREAGGIPKQNLTVVIYEKGPIK